MAGNIGWWGELVASFNHRFFWSDLMLFRRPSLFAVAVIFVATAAGSAFALPTAVPEVDPSSMAGAVAVLAAAGVFVADRIRRQFRSR